MAATPLRPSLLSLLALLAGASPLTPGEASSVDFSAVDRDDVPPSLRAARRLGKPTCTDGTCRKTCANCCPGPDCAAFEADCVINLGESAERRALAGGEDPLLSGGDPVRRRWGRALANQYLYPCPVPTPSPTPEPIEPTTPPLTPKPTNAPSAPPTTPPTPEPTDAPSASPTTPPTPEPTDAPSASPTTPPTPEPTDAPFASLTTPPTPEPTDAPSSPPTTPPSLEPTDAPFAPPTTPPTPEPIDAPSAPPTTPEPIDAPSAPPTNPEPTDAPSDPPTSPPTPELVVTTQAATTTMAVATTTQSATTPAGNSGQLYVVTNAAEIQDAMAMAQPGDTLLMALNGNWVDADIKFRGFGTAAAPITLRSESSTEPVVLSGASRLRMSGSHLVASGLKFHGGALTTSRDQVIQFRTSSSTSSELADHCRLTNTAIVNYNPSDSAFDYRWVGLYGTHNRVDHCYFSGKNNQGPLLIVWRRSGDNAQDFHTVERNYFDDFTSGGGRNGWETIRIGVSDTSLSDSSSVVSNNLFERCNGEAEIISVKSGDNVLKGNTFDSCQGSLTLRHGRGNTVDGNFFLGKGASLTGGVRIIDSDHTVINNYFQELRGMKERAAVSFTNGLVDSPLNGYHVAKRATVAFNTFYDCKEAFRLGAKSSTNPVAVEDCIVANNAVFSDKSTGSGASAIVYEEEPPTNMKYEGNYMHGEGRVVLGISLTAGIDEADPFLANVDVRGLHRPNATSPCISGAVGEYADPTDMDGQSRPASGKDVGADQVSGDAVRSKPLSASDFGTAIGPSWMLYSSAS